VPFLISKEGLQSIVTARCSLEPLNISVQNKEGAEERTVADAAGADAGAAGRSDFMLDRETMQVLEK
jgi:hypothetical protein